MGLNLLFYLIIFVFGLTVGSFLNCLIYRLQVKENFLIQRSYCPDCKRTLGWQDLIPLLSFIILRGKCRYCQKPISWQYPLVELTTGALFVFIAWSKLTANNEQLTVLDIINFGYLLTVICFLIIIFVSDLKYYIIPDKIIYPAIGIAIFYNFVTSYFILHTSSFINFFISAVLASAFFLLIILISRGKWMGWGDVKLAFFMGFFLGFPNILVALFLAFFFGAIIGIGLILAGRKTLKSEIPFGPFLVAGTFITLFWGKELIQLYSHLFLA